MTFGFMLIFAMSALLSVMFTPLVIRLAKRVGAIDVPNERKIHTHPIPRLGGVVVCVSFALSLGTSIVAFPGIYGDVWTIQYNLIVLALSFVLVLGLGVCDDLLSLNAVRKLVFQLVAGTLAYVAGLQVHTVSVPFGMGILDLGLFSYPATVLWVVGITNAFNLIDGLDGLASGVAMIASITIFVIANPSHDPATAMIALALAGAILGFLMFNFNPARIFLGDSGSLALGFVLAILSIHGSTKGSTAFTLIVPLLALGLPIMDTLLAMIRRVLRSFLPEAAGLQGGWLRLMFLPDKCHIHHQLLACGFSHRGAVVLLYVVSCVFGGCAFAVTTRGVDASLMLGLVGMSALVGVRLLGYKEMALLRNGMFLPLYDRPLFSRSAFHRGLDILFIIGAFFVSQQLAAASGLVSLDMRELVWTMVATCAIQASILSIGGLYKGTLRMVGVGDVVRLVKTVAVAAFISAVLLPVFIHGVNIVHFIIFWILDFYFLATCVIGARVSFLVLTYLFRKQLEGGKRVLIYGANTLGLLTLQKILNYDTPGLAPVGFLDDNPNLEGKVINGYPIFGGHWKLDGLLRKMGIQEILLSTEDLKPEAFRRLRSAAKEHGVVVRTAKIRLEDLRPDAKIIRSASFVKNRDSREQKYGAGRVRMNPARVASA